MVWDHIYLNDVLNKCPPWFGPIIIPTLNNFYFLTFMALWHICAFHVHHTWRECSLISDLDGGQKSIRVWNGELHTFFLEMWQILGCFHRKFFAEVVGLFFPSSDKKLPRKKMIIMDESTKFTSYVSLATNLCKKNHIVLLCLAKWTWKHERWTWKNAPTKGIPYARYPSLAWRCGQSWKSHIGVTWCYTMSDHGAIQWCLIWIRGWSKEGHKHFPNKSFLQTWNFNVPPKVRQCWFAWMAWKYCPI
jgi:hypothetical protein